MEHPTQLNTKIEGSIAMVLANEQTLDDFCAQYITDYNRDRFEAFAIRIFAGQENIITVYAVDKIRQEDSTIKPNALPVKKFKLDQLHLPSLLSYCNSFNCTLTTGNYNLEDMEVTNR